MNPIEEFYRKKQILGFINEWATPLKVNINEDRETVEISFNSDIGMKITKEEKINLLKIIMCNMEKSLEYHAKNPKVSLIKDLEDELNKLKEDIKKDLDIKNIQSKKPPEDKGYPPPYHFFYREETII